MRNDTRAHECSDSVPSPWRFSTTSADAVPELILVSTSVSVHIQHTHIRALSFTIAATLRRHVQEDVVNNYRIGPDPDHVRKLVLDIVVTRIPS